MKLSTLKLAVAAAVLTASSAVAAPLGWDAYAIRGLPTINETYGGDADAVQFIVNGSDAVFGGSAKAGLGTNNLNGKTIGEIGSIVIDRIDDHTRFTASTGGYYAPYMNFWVKDAAGRVAVLANEPSNAEWGGTSEWNTSGSNLANKTIKVFENEAGFQLPSGIILSAGGLTNGTFADFAAYEIAAPSAAYLALNEPLGSGAPRELGTNAAYGFNWIFGDTGGNYISDAMGYVVADPVVAAVPEPTTLAALAGASLLGLRRRRA